MGKMLKRITRFILPLFCLFHCHIIAGFDFTRRQCKKLFTFLFVFQYNFRFNDFNQMGMTMFVYYYFPLRGHITHFTSRSSRGKHDNVYLIHAICMKCNLKGIIVHQKSHPFYSHAPLTAFNGIESNTSHNIRIVHFIILVLHMNNIFQC